MPTMHDIAVRAGVSRSTVSFVLNDKHALMGVNDETRRRVLQVAEELGYRTNGLARAIATGKTPIFGFLIYDYLFDTEVTARIMHGIMDESDKCRHTVQVFRLSGKDGDNDVIQRCVEIRPAGVIGTRVELSLLRHLQQELSRLSIPMAIVDSTPALDNVSRFLSDDLEGCAQAIAHLAALGHKRIAFIGGKPETVASQLREEGYRRAMAWHGLEILPGYLEVGHWDIERTKEATRRLFRDLAVSPTAVFCADDKMAVIASHTLRDLGLRVPEDVSLVGYADLMLAGYNAPPLTTVSQPFREMGRCAVRRLLALSHETDGKGGHAEPLYEERLPTRFVVRQSTAPVRE